MKGPSPAYGEGMSTNVRCSLIVGDFTLIDLYPFVRVAPNEFQCEPLRDNHFCNGSVPLDLLHADLLPCSRVVCSDVDALAMSVLATYRVNEGEVIPFLDRA